MGKGRRLWAAAPSSATGREWLAWLLAGLWTQLLPTRGQVAREGRAFRRLPVSGARMTALGKGKAEEGSIHFRSVQLCKPPGDHVASTRFRAGQTRPDDLTVLSLVSSSVRGMTAQQC